MARGSRIALPQPAETRRETPAVWSALRGVVVVAAESTEESESAAIKSDGHQWRKRSRSHYVEQQQQPEEEVGCVYVQLPPHPKKKKHPPGSYIKWSTRHGARSPVTLGGKVPNDTRQTLLASFLFSTLETGRGRCIC